MSDPNTALPLGDVLPHGLPGPVQDAPEAPGRPMAPPDPATLAPGDADAGRSDPQPDPVRDVGLRAQTASRSLRTATRGVKDAALFAIADALEAEAERIVTANATDLVRAVENGMPAPLQDRLMLDAGRVHAIADAVREVAGLPDPVGEVIRGSTLANGLQLRQLRVPMGVVGMIYEARPNVTVDAAVLALKSGNAVILRGGSAALSSNEAIVAVIRDALVSQDLPADLVQTIDPFGRPGAAALMRLRGLVDVLVPRGGAGLIQSVVAESTVPVIETGVGNCHIFVDRSADREAAEAIVLNAKVQRPGVCNAAETLLVHVDIADRFLPIVGRSLRDAGVRLHADSLARRLLAEAGVDAAEATNDDWATEYGDMDLAIAVVESVDEAIEHIGRWSSGHTEAIVTSDLRSADRFTAEVDSAAVMVNASTRFTDGGQFGLGAEIGISTQKLHARGPMGLVDLTTTKWIVHGTGQIRP